MAVTNDNDYQVRLQQQLQQQQYQQRIQTAAHIMKSDKKSYTRKNVLGEGGFAVCYEVVDEKGNTYAAKVVSKQTLKGEKQRSKIADFGLAAMIQHEGERKKTICGTPNYIAPEVLFDSGNGHSYEVVFVGKPPFQTREVEAIYKKIKENQYSFPSDVNISADAKNLISQILDKVPERPPFSNITNVDSNKNYEYDEEEKRAIRTFSYGTNTKAKALNQKYARANINKQKNQVATSGNILDIVYRNICQAFEDAENNVEVQDINEPIENPKVFISKWIDYSNKYGLGYQLTNSCVGVYFNDSTSIILSADEEHFEYLYYTKENEQPVMQKVQYTLDNYPSDLHKKVVQVNFFDHTKLMFSGDGNIVSFVDRNRVMKSYRLLEFIKMGNTDEINRLNYIKSILEQLTLRKQKKMQQQ
ncbi:hypothetical protein BCR36DRAFT_588625 [Piromyces finnis]|uniref:Serine/threonine-protein kinase n=1 Tax=Piromyces finnis TaxID=1754191 RepID=A0A1Y1U730_9FUNG|nr:hypothetical protein BCR36DRAFT_588625 [Piromyces finnis]|eukprot:ORX33326.1 hypothetical protein BCR36DRAFT_588625 [Piromyces finnis]